MRETLTVVERANQELRQALAQITQTPQEQEEQISRIEALRSEHHHSIVLVPWRGKLSFNCVQYALDLIDLPQTIDLGINGLLNRGVAPRIHPLDTPLVHFLIKNNDLKELDHAEMRMEA